jgi:hypothetical protein
MNFSRFPRWLTRYAVTRSPPAARTFGSGVIWLLAWHLFPDSFIITNHSCNGLSANRPCVGCVTIARVGRRRRKDKSRRPTPTPQKGGAGNPSKTLSTWSVLFGVIAIAGFFLTVYTVLSPRVTVRPGAPLKPSDPFGTPFVFSNQGYLDVLNVRFSCTMNFKDANQNTLSDNTEMNAAYSVSRLARGHDTTVGCNFPSRGFQSFRTMAPILTADATVNVSFRGAFVPWRTERSFKFLASKDIGGEFHWLSWAAGK